MARRFGNIFRFIDGLTALSDCGEFERSFHEIYTPELEIKKEYLGCLEVSFLNIMITIKDEKFCTK